MLLRRERRLEARHGGAVHALSRVGDDRPLGEKARAVDRGQVITVDGEGTCEFGTAPDNVGAHYARTGALRHLQEPARSKVLYRAAHQLATDGERGRQLPFPRDQVANPEAAGKYMRGQLLADLLLDGALDDAPADIGKRRQQSSSSEPTRHRSSPPTELMAQPVDKLTNDKAPVNRVG